MKIKISLLIILICQITIAQQYIKIEFEQAKGFGHFGNFVGTTILTQNASQALYVEVYNEYKEESETEDGNLIVSLGGGKSLFFKDYDDNEIFYENTIQFKHFPTQENIDLMKWEIQPNKKEEILGYDCQVAVLEFRGRTYVAYFTDKLGFNGGPWKFDGLPGMILKISSTDGYLDITANSIEIKNDELKIENPYKGTKEFIDYPKFQELYTKKYKEMNRAEVLEGGGTMTVGMPACQIECHVTE